MPQAAQQQQMSPAQLNMLQRKAVLEQGVRMKQVVFQGTFNPTQQPVVTVIPRNVGLITRFIVECVTHVTNTDTGDATLTDFGVLNALSNIQFTDLQNNQRHNTYGFHFGLLASAKERMPFASAQQLSSSQGNFGNNFPIVQSVTPLPHTTLNTADLRTTYEIPIAYSDHDLRGAIYANVVANQMSLALTINPTPFAATGDDTYAIYKGATGVITSMDVTVYQEYIDQLPMGAQGVVLPAIDISTVYQLLFSNFTNIAVGQDFYLQYTNFRRYFSAFGVYNNSGTVGGRSNGSDINYWAQVSANFTNIWKVDPLEQARQTRRIIGSDPPLGVYYFPTRQQPIYTLTYGNMQIDLNPKIAGANAYLLMMWEFVALQNTLSNAGSLPANG